MWNRSRLWGCAAPCSPAQLVLWDTVAPPSVDEGWLSGWRAVCSDVGAIRRTVSAISTVASEKDLESAPSSTSSSPKCGGSPDRDCALDGKMGLGGAVMKAIEDPKPRTRGPQLSAQWSNHRDETLIIFDWDDTLCPTTHRATADPAALRRHEEAVEGLLRVAAGLGHVHIVSMALDIWIEESTHKYMPRIAATLEELRIPVSLARSGLSDAHIKRQAYADDRDPTHFLKRRAFTRVVKDFLRVGAARCPSATTQKKGRGRNIVSIGDSECERLALQDVMWHLPQDRRGRWRDFRCKTVKLKDEPTVSELTDQLLFLTGALPEVLRDDHDRDLELVASVLVDASICSI